VVERRGEWDEYVKIMDAERLAKISRNNIPAERSPECSKSRWSDLIPPIKRLLLILLLLICANIQGLPVDS
jgi:hypothetical protein